MVILTNKFTENFYYLEYLLYKTIAYNMYSQDTEINIWRFTQKQVFAKMGQEA